MEAQRVLEYHLNSTRPAVQDSIHHIVSGSFRSVSLVLLAFSSSTRSLQHVNTIPAFGPHQYLALNGNKDRFYATSWALPPSLSSWEIKRGTELQDWSIAHIDTTPITATSSYISIPPPYTHAYSVGGPTGEVHILDPETGGFGKRVQEILFVPEDQLASADKTRVALRYGSHGIEFTPSRRHAFVPVLGTNSIEMYEHDPVTGRLTHLASIGSPRGKDSIDGPRHVKVHPNGRFLYCVTEHNNLVDAYRILPTALEYVSTRSILPKHLGSEEDSHHKFRGDTLMLAPSTPRYPSPRFLVTTTRGSTTKTKGWLSILPLDEEGDFGSTHFSEDGADDDGVRFETPTSGGKANAIDLLSKGQDEEGVWILLTDDDDSAASDTGIGAVRVLEWDGWGKGSVKVVAEWPSSSADAEVTRDSSSFRGGSHALWLD